MTNRFRVSRALLKILEDMGLSVPAVLQPAGLPAPLFRQWEGTSPGDWRTTHRMRAPTAVAALDCAQR